MRYPLPLLTLALLLTGCIDSDPRASDISRKDPVSTSVTQLKPAATIRHVVTLGDSLAYGAGDEQRRGIAARLEKHLEERGVNGVETTNLGVNGAQTSDLKIRMKQQRVRDEIRSADVIVLSIGANDLFRTGYAREQTLKNPLLIANDILERISEVVADIRQLNPTTRILLLGAYNPAPRHHYGALITQYIGVWDQALAGAFADDPLVSVVRMSDLVTADRLSRLDSFHPGGEAYEAAARRIAAMLLDERVAA